MNNNLGENPIENIQDMNNININNNQNNNNQNIQNNINAQSFNLFSKYPNITLSFLLFFAINIFFINIFPILPNRKFLIYIPIPTYSIQISIL